MSTWLPAEADGDTPFARVFGLRPDLYEPYRDFVALFWQRRLVDPVLLELCRLRVAQLLGCESELALRTRTAVDAGLTDAHVAALAQWPTAEGFSDAQRAALALAEQFVIDPSGVDDDMRARVRSHLSSAELVALVEALALFDGFTRFALLLCNDETASVRVVDPPPAPPGEPPAPSEDADPAISKSALAEQPEALVAFLAPVRDAVEPRARSNSASRRSRACATRASRTARTAARFGSKALEPKGSARTAST